VYSRCPKVVSRRKKLIFGIITGALTVITIGVLGEIVLRICMKSSGRPFENPDVFYYVPDPNVGVWLGDPDNSRPFINSFGMYDIERKIEKEEGIFRIAVLGDSYMNGIHAELGYRMSDLIEKKNKDKVEVLNFGISSVGTVQEWFIYKSKVRRFRPDLVILGFLTGNDLRNNAERGSSIEHGSLPGVPHCRIEPDGSFQYLPAQSVPGTRRSSYTLRKYSYLYRFLRRTVIPKLVYALKRRKKKDASIKDDASQTDIANHWPVLYDDYGVYSPPVTREWQNAWAITENTLLEFKNEVEADGSRFLLVILTDPLQIYPDPDSEVQKLTGMSLPDSFSVDYPTNRLTQFAAANDIACLNLLPILREYAKTHNLEEPYFSFKTDGHWSRLGHRVAADIVTEYLTEHYRLDP